VVEFNRQVKQVVRLGVVAGAGVGASASGYLLGRHHGRRAAERDRIVQRARRVWPLGR
jgi:hypothetical protein